MKAEQFAWNNANNTKQTIITLPSTYDLNLNAGYNASRNVSIFAQLNNILAISPSLNSLPTRRKFTLIGETYTIYFHTGIIG